jgi:ADP-dependent phosphofructokinase/glucokinase
MHRHITKTLVQFEKLKLTGNQIELISNESMDFFEQMVDQIEQISIHFVYYSLLVAHRNNNYSYKHVHSDLNFSNEKHERVVLHERTLLN